MTSQSVWTVGWCLVLCSMFVKWGEAQNYIPCPAGSGLENIIGSPVTVCYGLVDPAKGVMPYAQAVEECTKMKSGAHPVLMSKKTYLKDVRDWAIKKGLPTDGEAGFWTAFTRETPAPLEADGTLSAANAAIRKNKSLFKYKPKNYGVKEDILWRNETQPGNTVDERDEMCTAQRSPGNPDYLGIDDYPCDGYQLHYAVCIWW